METVKRLAPLDDTLRRLYTLSGNQCAFPGCCHPMFNNEGNFVGQICHIEAAMPGGERFNSNMTNEQRRAFDNLMLMCYDHHIETNKVDLYPVYKMQQIKQQHENMYANIDSFINKMQSSIVDVTSNITPNMMRSLTNLYRVCEGLDTRISREIEDDVRLFNNALPSFSSLSPDAKNVFSICISRAKHTSMKMYIDPLEIQRVTAINSTYLNSIFTEIEAAGFASYDEDDRQIHIFFPDSEVNFWEMIQKYCSSQNLSAVDIVSNMKFSIFD